MKNEILVHQILSLLTTTDIIKANAVFLETFESLMIPLNVKEALAIREDLQRLVMLSKLPKSRGVKFNKTKFLQHIVGTFKGHLLPAKEITTNEILTLCLSQLLIFNEVFKTVFLIDAEPVEKDKTKEEMEKPGKYEQILNAFAFLDIAFMLTPYTKEIDDVSIWELPGYINQVLKHKGREYAENLNNLVTSLAGVVGSMFASGSENKNPSDQIADRFEYLSKFAQPFSKGHKVENVEDMDLIPEIRAVLEKMRMSKKDEALE